MGINTLTELERKHDSYGNEIDLIDICICMNRPSHIWQRVMKKIEDVFGEI